MAVIPVAGTMPAFPQGSQFVYPVTLTIDTDIPDPNTWTNCRLAIIPPTGTAVVVSKSSFTNFTVTGSGPWTVEMGIPVTQTQTLSLPARICNFQLDFLAGTSRDILVNGNVQVIAPNYPIE